MPESAERSIADVQIFAPGKLVMIGEYAVVDGAPALVLAIDRGVRCDVHLGGPSVDIHTPDGDTRFVAPALRDAPHGRYVFGQWNPVDLPGKPGFGGSAAACVAACVAAGLPPHHAAEIHHQVQGSGSGVDVAASVHGGMIRFQRDHPPLAVPPVCPLVLWSGQSARTGPRVRQYQSWAGRERFAAQSTALVDHFHADPVATLAAAGDLLESMADQANVAYRTPGLDRIRAIAREHGGAAKASGAGGGDCAIALFVDPDAADACARACADAGLTPIPVQVAAGARRLVR